MPEVRIYNTLTGRVEALRPRGLDERSVNMYVCGPTVYDSPHIGHARSYVFFDTLKRVLRLCGYQVHHMQNFSDVDEKIDIAAARASISPAALAEQYIGEFFQAMDALNVERADRYVRASECREFMHLVTSRFIESGRCYRAGQNVYFDASSGGGFGSLLHSPLERRISGEEWRSFTFEKRDKEDFTVWLGEFDPSDASKGRPSWNLECFSIVHRWFSCELDIQGGGMDLLFPHHEVGSVISKSYCKVEFAGHYIHHGFVTASEEKMSKSKGNFVTVAELLHRYPAGAIRLYLLSRPFRDNIEFDDDDMEHYSALYTKIRERMSRGIDREGNASRIMTILCDNIATEKIVELFETELDTMSGAEFHSAASALGLT